MRRFERLWEKVQEEIPGARVLQRSESTFLKVIFGVLGFLVKLFTLWRVKPNWSGFTTTISRTMYVPDGFWEDGKDWDDERRYRLLRHELVHMRQFREWPMKFLARPWLWPINAVIMGFCYIFAFPVIWTFRAKFEREGYTQSMLTRYEIRGNRSANQKKWYAEHMGKTFGTSVYFWMWTRKAAEKWAMETMEKIERGEIRNDRDNVDYWPVPITRS